MSGAAAADRARGQSHVVGTTLLLGMTVIALGTLVGGVGTVIDAQAGTADAARVASATGEALEPMRTTGPGGGDVAFASGRLATASRDLRIRTPAGVVYREAVDALVYTSGERRVAYLAGAIVRGRGDRAWLVDPPRVAGAVGDDVLLVTAPKLDAGHQAVAGEGGVTARLRTNVSHHRIDLGEGEFSVALETATPAPLARHFREDGASVRTTDIDGDGLASVVATYPGRRTGHVVVHNLSLAVGDG